MLRWDIPSSLTDVIWLCAGQEGNDEHSHHRRLLAVVAILFIPGYIFLQFTKNAVAFIPQAVDARYFFAVVTWGGLAHLSFYWWTEDVLGWYLAGALDQHEGELALWGFLVLIAAPLCAGLLGSWLLQSMPLVDRQLGRIGMDYVSRTPTAWNYAVELGPRWVRVHLKDGTRIGGVYQSGSFADNSGEQDLFLERVYNLNEKGDFGDEVAEAAPVCGSRMSRSATSCSSPCRNRR